MNINSNINSNIDNNINGEQDMKKVAMIYTPARQQRSWKWGKRTAVYVVYGPKKELQQFRTLNSVGKSRCPNTKAEYFGEGDSRFAGPHSHFGQLLSEAKDWAKSHNLELMH